MDNFSEYVSIIVSLVSGIGIFLLGMKFLSDGLQNIAGNRLKTLIGIATNNRFFGIGIGILVTGIIQSSSITTVLVVSFVDSGLMTLAQAVGVIMGANIGTTLTAWILTIKIDEYGLPIAGIAAIVYVFGKKETIRYVAISVLGLGCVFLGLLFMKEAVIPIKDNPEFVALFKTFQANNYFGVLKCAALGCLLTLMVQSSSVTVGITMVLASQGLIGFHTAAALILGENVGTTITAILASLAANNNARRAAYFHALFNLFGVFYITLLFNPFINIVEWGLNTFFNLSNLENSANIAFGIAAVHSTFNIINTIIFIIPCRLIAQLLENQTTTTILTNLKLLKKETKQAPEIESILTIITNNKESSLVRFVDIEARIQRVLTYMISQLKIGVLNLKTCIENPKKKTPETDKIFEIENEYDKIKAKLQEVLTSFVGKEETTNSSVQAKIFVYEEIVDHLESSSDYIAQIAKLQLRLLDNKTDLLEYQKQDLLKLNGLIYEAIENMSGGSHKKNKLQRTKDHEIKFATIKEYIRTMRTTFWNVSGGTITNPIIYDTYSNMLTSYRKVRDHLRKTGNIIFRIDKD